MPVQSWAPKGSPRCDWLMSHKEDYLAALDGGKLKDWFSDLLRRYFVRFHWSIPDDANPDTTPKVDLNDYGDDDPERKVLSDTRAAIYDAKNAQLKSWFYNHYGYPRKRQCEPSSALPVTSDLPATGSLLTSATSRQRTMDKGPPAKHKSHRTELQSYISLYYRTKFKDEVDAAFQNAKNIDPSAKRVNIMTCIAQQHYAEETGEVKDKVRRRVEELRRLDTNQNAVRSDVGVPDGSTLRERVDALPSYLQQVFGKLNELTGFRFSIYYGGDDEEGQPMVYSVHVGSCGGPLPSTFGAFMGREFNETFESKFREFVSYQGTEDEVPFDKTANAIHSQSSLSTPLGKHERGRSLSHCCTQDNPHSHPHSQSHTHPCSQAQLSSHASEHERGHFLPPHPVPDGTRDHSRSRSRSQSHVHTHSQPRSTPDHAHSHPPLPCRSKDGTPTECAAYPSSCQNQHKNQRKNPFPLSVELPSKNSRPVSRCNAPQSPSSPGSVPASDGANGRTRETQLGNSPDKLGGTAHAKDKLCTTVVPRMTKRHAMELSASRKARRQLLDQSPSGGSSTADLPNIPGWLEPHIVYLEGITSDEPWCRLLELWKGIEAKNAADSYKSKLKQVDAERPAGIGEWIKRQRVHTYRPEILNAQEYGRKWLTWWEALQPEARRCDSAGNLIQQPCANLGDAVVCGPNGFLNIVFSLVWWRLSLEVTADKTAWHNAVKDVVWVLETVSSD